MKYKSLFLILLATALGLSFPVEAFARATFFHATKKAIAQKIRAKGFSVWKGKAGSRFGKNGIYGASSAKTAMKEKTGAEAVIRMKSGRYFDRHIMDFTKPTPNKIRSFARVRDLRGKVKKGIIGPKLGQKLGRNADRTGLILRYRSAKDPNGSNYFVPKSVVRQHPPKFSGVRDAAGGHYR